MGSRWGDDVACSVCGQTYRAFRTGETFASIRKQIPEGKHKRLNSVLGTWHEHKLALWNEHADRCWTYSGNAGVSPDRVSKPLPLDPGSARARTPEGRRVRRKAPSEPALPGKVEGGTSGRGRLKRGVQRVSAAA